MSTHNATVNDLNATINDLNATVNNLNVTLNDNDLTIVNEIDKFLEDYTSDGAERMELTNLSNELDEDFLKNFDAPDLEVNDIKTVETHGLDFIGHNSANFHLLDETFEEFVTYDQYPNEINWNNFHPTLPLDEQNQGVKEEFKYDEFISNSITTSKMEMENLSDPWENSQNSNIEQTMIEAKQYPTNKQNQGNIFLEEICKETILFDELQKTENFSLPDNCNNNQKDITTTENPCETLKNSSTPLHVTNKKTGTHSNFSLSLDKNDNIQDNFSNQQNLKRKNNKKSDNSFPRKKPLPKSNYRKSNWKNQKKTREGNIRGLKKKEPFQYNSQKKYSSSRPINGINYSIPKIPFAQPVNSKLQSNKPFLSGVQQPAKKMQDKNQFGKDMPCKWINQDYQNSNVGNYRSAYNDIDQTYNSTATSQFPNDVNGYHYSLNPYDLNKKNMYKQQFNMPHYENNFVGKHSDSSVMPVQQNFHGPNLHYPQKRVNNGSVSTDQGNIKKKCTNVLLQVIKDNLRPMSLNENTIQFSSKKLVKTKTRDELIIAFKTHGTIQNSWWTPDDKIFVTYTRQDIAQFVYGMYLKS